MQMTVRHWFGALAEYFGAHDVPDWTTHEIDRAKQRTLGSVLVSAVWLVRYVATDAGTSQDWLVIALSVAYFGSSLVHRHLLLASPAKQVFSLYLFLSLDPIVLIVVLTQDPQTFAFLNPFLLVVIVRSGIRYGIRTMYLSWGLTLAASTYLLTRDFWLTNIELTLAFLLMLLFVPAFFASLIRRIHNIRAIEEDRARLAGIHDSVLARNKFLGKVSHELRSALQGVVSTLDIFEMRHRHRSGTADDELVARLRRASLLLNTHLRDLLTLAKGEAGQVEIRPVLFEAGSLVQAIAEGGREYASSRGLELVVDLPHEAAFVVADGARIDQVLTNLVINSIRYTETGQVRVTLQEYSPNERILRFTVADTGLGVPASVLPGLLDPENPSLANGKGEGSGIGLAVVRTLVDQLGGKISVTSGPVEGTTFKVEIPAEPVREDAAIHSSGELSGRVLVVDDRDDVLVGVAAVVDELGFECDQVTSAAAATNLLATRRYDTVLLDIEMPVKGGAVLAAETRRGGGPNSTARLVGMSAADVSEDLRRQFDACLTKPIDFAALRSTLLVAVPTSRPSQPGLWLDEAAS